jgi:signal transduction histidine kinase
MAPQDPGHRVARSLGVRLVVGYGTIFLASTLLISVLAYRLLERSLVERDHEIVRAKLADYAVRFDSTGVEGLTDAVAAEQASGSDERLFVRLVSSNAELVLASVPSAWGTYDLGQLGDGQTGVEGWQSVPARNAPVVLEVATRRLPGGVFLQVGRTTLERDRTLRQVRDLLGVLLASVVVLGLIGGSAITWTTLAPLRRLLDTLREITRTGRFDARVPSAAGHDVLSELEQVSNQMLERIQTLVGGMRGALDTVAHDLRTPIARLRSRAEAALLAGGDEHAAREALADVVEESDRVSSLLTTLMDISEAETGVMQLHPTPVDVGDVCAETVDLYEDVAEQKTIALASTAPAGLVVSADRARLRQVLANLVDNAVKYTPAGGHVTISAAASDDTVTIAVTDTGPGIGAEHVDHVWDRLYRGDVGGEPGLGLGLSLVRAVVTAHGGSVSVETKLGHGTTFRIAFPRAGHA